VPGDLSGRSEQEFFHLKTILRSVITLLIVLWLGAVMFFPVVAWVAFGRLPDAHAAGLVVRNSLLALHTEGLVAGVCLLVLLPLARWARAYHRSLVGPVLCVAAMLALTAFSQFRVMPRMEVDRLAVGGAIDRAPQANPQRLDFERLHQASVTIEEGVLAAGIGFVVLLARPARRRPETQTTNPGREG
jgi:hypothetical protein